MPSTTARPTSCSCSLDDGLRRPAALEAAGVAVRTTSYFGMPHGSLAFPVVDSRSHLHCFPKSPARAQADPFRKAVCIHGQASGCQIPKSTALVFEVARTGTERIKAVGGSSFLCRRTLTDCWSHAGAGTAVPCFNRRDGRHPRLRVSWLVRQRRGRVAQTASIKMTPDAQDFGPSNDRSAVHSDRHSAITSADHLGI